jgi:hypothetical protein
MRQDQISSPDDRKEDPKVQFGKKHTSTVFLK